MVGTAYLDDKIYEPLQAAYDKVPVLAEQYPSKEQVIDTEADFFYMQDGKAVLERKVLEHQKN